MPALVEPITEQANGIYRMAAGSKPYWNIYATKQQRPLCPMPYASGEIFYEERIDQFDQNRFALGVSTNIAKGVDFDIYLMRRHDRSGKRWLGKNILGTTITFAF